MEQMVANILVESELVAAIAVELGSVFAIVVVAQGRPAAHSPGDRRVVQVGLVGNLADNTEVAVVLDRRPVVVYKALGQQSPFVDILGSPAEQVGRVLPTAVGPGQVLAGIVRNFGSSFDRLTSSFNLISKTVLKCYFDKPRRNDFWEGKDWTRRRCGQW